MWLLALILGLVGAVTTIGLGVSQNKTNTENVQQSNQENYKIAQMTNQSNVEQANLAYQRSLPLNQVNNLMAAGMSRQGALSSLTGGGSYTAPVMNGSQAQAPQVDYSSISSAMERLQNIPANVEQSQLIDQQRHSLAVDTQNKINADARAQEQHEFNMWKQGYDKNTALMLDSGSSKVANALMDSGKNIEDFKDFESMIRDLGLAGDKDIRNLTHVARQQLEDGVRSKFGSERARQQQENQNLASADQHKIDVQHLKDMREDYSNAVKEHKTQDKERLVREGVAELQKILNDRNISIEKFRDSIRFDSDGKPNLLNRAEEHIKESWRFIGDLFGIGYLGDVLRGLFAVVPK